MHYLNKDNTMIMFHKIILDVNIINSIIREDYCNFNMRGSRNFHERGSSENGTFWSQTRGVQPSQKSRNYLFLGKIFKFQGGPDPRSPPPLDPRVFKSYQNERISLCVILTRHLVINLSRCGRSTKQIDKRKVEMMPTTLCTYTLPYFMDVTNSKILPGYRTDHSQILLQFDFGKFVKGNSYWKFNNSLLRDLKFIEEIKELIRTIKLNYILNEEIDETNINEISAQHLLFLN